MLTPKFEINQNEEFIVINIHCPFAKVSETEIFIEDNEFKFYSSPYYLRVILPGSIIEDDRASAKYDSDRGSFVVTVAKVTRGEHFEGLDLLTRLLATPETPKTKQPTIEVIGGSESNTNDEQEDSSDWFIHQEPCQEAAISLDGPKYGFANRRTGVFTHLQSELIGLVDLPDPDFTPANERLSLRESHEQDKFDASHYLADLYDTDFISSLIDHRPWWSDAPSSTQMDIAFKKTEKDQMLKLPRKEYLLDSTELSSAYLGLLDILLAYCYDARTTQGEHNVESGWTISKLSSTLSWLQSFGNVKAVLTAFYRRSITYPLYRNWRLSRAVVADACQLLSLGKKAVLKCFLAVHHLLTDCDVRYVLNDIYITDYCVWIQSASNDKLTSLSTAVNQTEISKSDVNLQLVDLEKAADLVSKESNADEMAGLQEVLSGLHLDPCGQCTDSDDVSTSSGEEYTESDEDSTSGDRSTYNEDVTNKECTESDDKNSTGNNSRLTNDVRNKECTESDDKEH